MRSITALLLVAFLGVLASAGLVQAADIVGHITKAEGRVEFLKQGKLPVTTAKVNDGVEVGDVLRTKSLSRAQITFMDNTTVTLSPESRIAIEAYMFDAAKKKRNAVLQLFQGVAHFVVTQVFKVKEPDFVVKTHTAVMGVRGTDVGLRLSPNDSTFLCFKGLVRVANIFPEVSGTFKKAEKVAFSFPPSFVDLKSMQGATVARNLPPVRFIIHDVDRQLFMQQLKYGILGRNGGGWAGFGPSGPLANLPQGVNPALVNWRDTIMANLAITPRLANAGQTSTESFTFSQIFSGGLFSLTPQGAGQVGSFSGSFSSVSRSVAYPGSFANNSFTLVTSPDGAFSSDSGTFSVNANTFSVSGPRGGTLTGTGSIQANAVGGSSTTSLNLTGPVSIAPGGAMTFPPGSSSTFVNGENSGSVTGTMTSK